MKKQYYQINGSANIFVLVLMVVAVGSVKNSGFSWR